MCFLVWFPKCLHWPFCPGVFIAILAFVAAAVTFREEPGKKEKAVWLLVFFGLMFAEVWMMSKDRDLNDAARDKSEKELAAQFDKIGVGITTTIQNSDKQFAATMESAAGIRRQVSKSLSISMGGDSYCYFDASIFGAPGKQEIGIFPVHVGTLGVPDLNYRITRTDRTTMLTKKGYQPLCVEVKENRPIVSFPITGDNLYFEVSYSTANGIWEEELRMRKVKDEWERAIRAGRLREGSIEVKQLFHSPRYPIFTEGPYQGGIDWVPR